MNSNQDNMNALAYELTYAHCIRYTPNKPDAAPYSDYVFRSVRVNMLRSGPDARLGETTDSFCVLLDGRRFCWGDTKDEANHHAAYTLMDESRVAAERAAYAAA